MKILKSVKFLSTLDFLLDCPPLPTSSDDLSTLFLKHIARYLLDILGKVKVNLQ